LPYSEAGTSHVIKTELHAHTDADPADLIAHSVETLIDRAAADGYGALAVTLHDRYFDPAPYAAYAGSRGIVLLPGIERTLARRHILLINFPRECAAVGSLGEIAALKAAHPRGLVIAPHAFYPTTTALGRELDRHADLVDAVEVNAMYTTWLDFNRRAIEWAAAHGKPLVGSSDLHLLEQMGTTYSLVDAAPEPDAICDAIRRGRVEVRSSPLASLTAASLFTRMCWSGIKGRLRPRA
jgi:predicted metal-dependent phosphoesterase TrpH